MRFCVNCGGELPEGKLTCPNCGAPAPIEEETESYRDYKERTGNYTSNYRHPKNEGGYASREPVYDYAPKRKTPERVLGTGGYFGSLLLMHIPVIGLLLQIIWACGGTGSLNRRNHARATLIFSVIGIVLAVALWWAIKTYIVPIFETLDPETIINILLS